MTDTIRTAAVRGIDAQPVTIEIHVAANGLPSYSIVGLPDASERESRDRIRAAILSANFRWPQARITINIAPSGIVRRQVPGLDLPIALAILSASGQIPGADLADYGAFGELGLDGTIRPVIAAVSLSETIDAHRILTCPQDAQIGNLVTNGRLVEAETLRDAVDAITEQRPPNEPTNTPSPASAQHRDTRPALSVAPHIIRAVEVAGAGGHHMFICGPPGSRKTAIAAALGELLPNLNSQQSRAVLRVHSAAGHQITNATITRPPVRQPNHTASTVAMIGGGTATMRPGEAALATNGVLVLDDLSEYPASVLDSLRQPMESQTLTVARAERTATYPAAFLTVATTTPCPCGHTNGHCRCSQAARNRYARRLPGALLDRFHIRVTTTNSDDGHSEPLHTIAQRVAKARNYAEQRGITANAHLHPDDADAYAALTDEANNLLAATVAKGTLTKRGRSHVVALALTITDLDNPGQNVSTAAISEAIEMRTAQLPTPLAQAS